MIPGLPDLKTPLVWLLGVGLACALIGLGVQHIKVADVREELATEKAARSRENAVRAMAAARDADQVAKAEQNHATTQQEIVHELVKPDPALAAALADNRALSGRLRDTSAKLAAARDQPQAASDPAACRDQGDQRRALFDLLAEAGRLSDESVSLAAEGRSVVVRRDAEVRALKALVQADRNLMEQAGASPPP